MININSYRIDFHHHDLKRRKTKEQHDAVTIQALHRMIV